MSNKKSSKSSNTPKPSKPIVVGLIYAEWCGFCKSMKPDWEKLEGEFADNENIEIIKIDDADPDKVTKMENLHPRLVAEGYPTIFKISKNKGKSSSSGGGDLEYFSKEKDRTFDNFRDWASSSAQTIKTGGCGCGSSNMKRGKRSKKTNKSRRHSKRKYYTKKSRKN